MKRFTGFGLAVMAAWGLWAAVAAAQDNGANCCGAPLCKAATVCVSDCPVRLERCNQAMGRNVKYAKGYVYTWQGFPGNCGTAGAAQVLLEKRAPATVGRGDLFTYEIQVSNRSADKLANVSVSDALPADFTFESADPAVTAQDGKLFFFVGDLPARCAKVFKVSGRAGKLGCLLFCGTAAASFEMPLNIAVNVVEARLELSLQAGVDGCGDLCDPVPAMICVKSPGSAVSVDNQVTINLPEGVTMENGDRTFTWAIGDLAPGQAKTIPFPLAAKAAGDYDLYASVRNASGQTAADSTKIKIRQPNIVVTKRGMPKGYLGHELVYDVEVTNLGDCPARDVCLIDVWNGAKVKLSTVTPKAAARGGKLVWNIGTLLPQQTFTARVALCALEVGQIENVACVTAHCSDPKEARIATEIVGASGVLSEVVDLVDPVPVGCETTYRVSASNQGPVANTNIRFTATLDAGMEFVGATGPTKVTADGATLTFEPLPSLGGKQKAVWDVVVRMASEGDKRFETRMLTDQLDSGRPVVNSESTAVYQPQMTVSSSSN